MSFSPRWQFGGKRIGKTSAALPTETSHAISLQPLPGHPEASELEAAVEAAARGSLVQALKPLRFEDAMRPLKRADGSEGLLVCNGDAEVWHGVLDLTPLRKGMGLAGAAWFHRPLKVALGFETEFKFRVTPPAPYLDTSTNQWLYPRAADGFAFVLHLDGHGPHALGSAGVQLGFGGIANCALWKLAPLRRALSALPRATRPGFSLST